LKEADTVLECSSLKLVNLRQISAESFRRQEHAGQGKLLVESSSETIRQTGALPLRGAPGPRIRNPRPATPTFPYVPETRRPAGNETVPSGRATSDSGRPLSEPALERALAPPDRPGEMMYRNEARDLRISRTARTVPGWGLRVVATRLRRNPWNNLKASSGACTSRSCSTICLPNDPHGLERDAGVRQLRQIHVQDGKRALRSETNPCVFQGPSASTREAGTYARSRWRAAEPHGGGCLLRRGRRNKYEIDASIGEDPVPFVAMDGPRAGQTLSTNSSSPAIGLDSRSFISSYPLLACGRQNSKL